MELNELVKKTEQWFIDRSLDKAEPSKQMLKLYEEYGELCGGYVDDLEDVSKDSIGDMLVVLIGLSKQLGVKSPINYYELDYAPSETKDLFIILVKDLGFLSQSIAKNMGGQSNFIQLSMVEYTVRRIAKSMGLDYKECLELAYDEIKDRKGKLINGVFIKEEDLHEG